MLLQIFNLVPSERMLIEQLDYNLLFRWLVGVTMDDPVWNHAVFTKNLERSVSVSAESMLALSPFSKYSNPGSAGGRPPHVEPSVPISEISRASHSHSQPSNR
jgi:hypothetical protein